MVSNAINPPFPELRIVPTSQVLAHENHDAQRSLPLRKVIQESEMFTNPPVVISASPDKYVLLDGANRRNVFGDLEYPHILVQVAEYGQFVELDVWKHVVTSCDWNTLEVEINNIDGVQLTTTKENNAIARIQTEEKQYTLAADVNTVRERNRLLCSLTQAYQKHAKLFRTALSTQNAVWKAYTDVCALISFPKLMPDDIIDAALNTAFLPPGVSRHIIHGRALRLQYPMQILRDRAMSLGEKNMHLKQWYSDKLAHRSIRYYAESTFQFDE